MERPTRESGNSIDDVAHVCQAKSGHSNGLFCRDQSHASGSVFEDDSGYRVHALILRIGGDTHGADH